MSVEPVRVHCFEPCHHFVFYFPQLPADEGECQFLFFSESENWTTFFIISSKSVWKRRLALTIQLGGDGRLPQTQPERSQGRRDNRVRRQISDFSFSFPGVHQGSPANAAVKLDWQELQSDARSHALALIDTCMQHVGHRSATEWLFSLLLRVVACKNYIYDEKFFFKENDVMFSIVFIPRLKGSTMWSITPKLPTRIIY